MKASQLIVPLLLNTVFLVSPPVVDAQDQSESSVRATLRSLQAQIDELHKSQFEVVFRDESRHLVLAPGETAVFAVTCQDGEVVVAGGYNSSPSELLQIVLNTPFFDGVHSGWRVDFHNHTDTEATVDTRVTLSCTKGVGRGT
jgi:hypothetical protein